jgi:hypothetical protein
MSDKAASAKASAAKTMGMIILIGVAMVIGALWYVAQFGPLTAVVVAATASGVFLSVLLGCGLFALGFYSDKSGHDDAVIRATTGS